MWGQYPPNGPMPMYYPYPVPPQQPPVQGSNKQLKKQIKFLQSQIRKNSKKKEEPKKDEKKDPPKKTFKDWAEIAFFLTLGSPFIFMAEYLTVNALGRLLVAVTQAIANK